MRLEAGQATADYPVPVDLDNARFFIRVGGVDFALLRMSEEEGLRIVGLDEEKRLRGYPAYWWRNGTSDSVTIWPTPVGACYLVAG